MWQKLLQLQFAANPGEVLAWMVQRRGRGDGPAYGGDLRQGFAATRDGPRTITRWTSALRTAMNAAPGPHDAVRRAAPRRLTDDNGLLFVHAGVDPRRAARRRRATRSGGARTTSSSSTAPFDGFRRVVRGFDRDRRGLVERDFAVSVDAGAGRGGPLLAACFAADGAVVDLMRGVRDCVELPQIAV